MSQCAASKLHVLSEEPYNKSSSTDRSDHVVASTLTEGRRSVPLEDPNVHVMSVSKIRMQLVSINCI